VSAFAEANPTTLKMPQGNAVLAAAEGLTVALPTGATVVQSARISVTAGTVVTILGPSGAGKTTILRALLSPDELRRDGYMVGWQSRQVAAAPAFVPQRGALLDHIDVSENIALAQAGGGLPRNPTPWLKAVGLDDSIGAPGRNVGTLSGGQAQRVAVARVLAAGRKLIVMDEPSVGFDPVGVRSLARLLVKQARDHDAGIIVITHDLALAGGASDEILFLDPTRQQLVPVMPQWKGPAEWDEPLARQKRLADLEVAVERLLLQERPQPGAGQRRKRLRVDLFGPFRTAGEAIIRFWTPRLVSESAVVFRRTIAQGLVRPLPFYVTVGLLLGLTVPYVIAHISSALKPSAVLHMIGGTYILSLAPPISAIVFAATSGSAINAWLGGLRLHGQVTALEGLGVAPGRYLWSPTWTALVLSYLVTILAFAAAMVAGGFALFTFYDVPDALSVLTSDFRGEPASRLPALVRGLWLMITYAVAMASIVVSKGREPKGRSEEVTSAMTSSVIRATLFVVVMELATVIALYAWTGEPR
jgi:ABC-type nitrate/sulfonate/bicarbonate transport system ATPase subunit/ABC-type transporter Mla maintaining outer membrane lipid asymmetry permease subunit MlaE